MEYLNIYLNGIFTNYTMVLEALHKCTNTIIQRLFWAA